MTQTDSLPQLVTDLPPDLEHAAMIREEVLDWLEEKFPDTHTFSTGELLQMVREQGRRWLISRLRTHDIANEAEIFDLCLELCDRLLEIKEYQVHGC